MNAQYQWHENVQIVNDYDANRTANLLLPTGVACPREFTEADFKRLYPSGAHIYTAHFFGVHCGWVAVPNGMERCAVCYGGNDRCASCGGCGYVAPASDATAAEGA